MSGFRKTFLCLVLSAFLLRGPFSFAAEQVSDRVHKNPEEMSCVKLVSTIGLTAGASLYVAGLVVSSILQGLAAMRTCFMTDNLHEIVKRNGFSKGRTLEDYVDFFGPEFSEALAALPDGAHWIDMGSGENRAIEEFMRGAEAQGRRVFATGITYKAGREIYEPTPGLRVLEGRYLENIANQEIVGPPYGKADIITDVMGVLSYADHVDDTLRTYVQLLKPNGVIYIYTSIPNTQIKSRNGSELDLEEWLKTIPGLVVESSPYGKITIRLKKGDPIIPELKVQSVKAGCPPTRIYTREN